jgi:hypothetical protein
MKPKPGPKVYAHVHLKLSPTYKPLSAGCNSLHLIYHLSSHYKLILLYWSNFA